CSNGGTSEQQGGVDDDDGVDATLHRLSTLYSHASKRRVKANSDSAKAPAAKARAQSSKVNMTVSPGWTRRHSCAGCYGRTISPPGSDGKGSVLATALVGQSEAEQRPELLDRVLAGDAAADLGVEVLRADARRLAGNGEAVAQHQDAEGEARQRRMEL